MDTSALSALLAQAVEKNPALLTAIFTQMQAAPAPQKVTAKDKAKAAVAAQYINVAEVVLSEYLTVSVTVKKTGDNNAKGYALLEFSNPQRKGGGKGAYGRVWLYKKEFIATVNWMRDAGFTKILTALEASGLTNA